jgi:hypothetical protein
MVVLVGEVGGEKEGSSTNASTEAIEAFNMQLNVPFARMLN